MPRPSSNSALLILARLFVSDERGTLAVQFALLAIPLFAGMGLAVDYARMLDTHERIQRALDSAILAAANAPQSQDRIALARTYFRSNMKGVPKEAAADFSWRADGALKGVASLSIKTPMIGILGYRAARVSAAAAGMMRREQFAAAAAKAVTPCIHVMDQSGSKTFWLEKNAKLDAGECAVRVRSNHRSEAVYETGSTDVKFANIEVKGRANVSDSLKIVSPPYQVLQDANVTGNPYEEAIGPIVRSITAGACSNTNTGKTWSGIVNPGTYCGKTEFKNATFNTGIYVIGSDKGTSGSLLMSGSLNASAGVTFYFSDNKSQLASYNANAGAVLKAPSSGLTKGILFLENSNRGAAYDFVLQTCKANSWTGLIYMPSLNLTIDSLENWPDFNVAMTVNQLKMKSLSLHLTPFAWTPPGANKPIAVDEAPAGTILQGKLIE